MVKIPNIDDVWGDDDAVILRLVPYAESLAQKYATEWDIPYESDEMRGEAVVKLVEVLKKIREKSEKIDKFRRILCPSIRNHLYNYVRDNVFRTVDVWKATNNSAWIGQLTEQVPPNGRSRILEFCEDSVDNAIIQMGFDKCPVQDIAAYLDISQKEVKSRAQRILNLYASRS